MSAPSAINNARQIIIGKTPVALGATDLKSAAFEAAEGEIGVFTKEGTRVNTVNLNISAGMEFVIAVSRGAGKAPLVSDLIDGSKVTVANAKTNDVATEQSLAIGYNGTSGLIADVATYAGELYKVTILVHQFLSGTDSEKLKAGYYQSQLTDGQAEIALGIRSSVNKNFNREVSNSDGDKPIVAKALCSDAGVVTAASTGTLTTTKGSALVGASGAGIATQLPVGAYVRFGTAQTDAVYKVVAVDQANNTITVDSEVLEASATLTAGNAETISAALGAAADWGIVLDGTALPFNRSKKRYAKCRFDVSLSESFGSTAAANTANASEGSGTPESVAQLENFLARFMSESYEMGSPFIFDIDEDLLADLSAAGYGLITLKWSDTRVVSFQNEVSPKELVIAIPVPVAGGPIAAAYAVTPTDGLCDLLEFIIPANAQVSATLVP